MIIVWILGAMWAVGSLAAIGYFLFDMCETKPGLVVGWLLGIPIWTLCGLGPLALINHESGPQLATLLKSEWHCSSAHEETTTTYVQVGKAMVPSTSTTSVCDAYGRN